MKTKTVMNGTTKTKTPDFTNYTMTLSYEQRSVLIDKIAEKYLDSMDGRGLEQFFYDVQTEYLASYEDEELLSEAESLVEENEFQEIMGYEA